MKKKIEYKVIELIIEPVIYTAFEPYNKNDLKVKTNALITFQFDENQFWKLMTDDSEYEFAYLQEQVYKDSKILLSYIASWDYDKFTITYWCKVNIEYFPTVEEYFKLLYQYNHI